MTKATCEVYDLTFNSKLLKDTIESNVDVGNSVAFIHKGGSNSLIMLASDEINFGSNNNCDGGTF